MFEFLGQFDQLFAGVCGVFVGALGCWFVQQLVRREPRAVSLQQTPALQNSPRPALQAAMPNHDADAGLKQRAADDELVLQWLQENPAGSPRNAAHPELALSQIASELLPFNPVAVRLIGKTAESDMTAAVERIEMLLASVDPPQSLTTLPLGTMPAALEPAATIRDPQGRVNPQPEDPQRRRSDQAIIYDTLLRRCLGDDDFAWRMLHKFPSRCRAEIDSLATELRRRAWTAATRRISQLRGMAANLAADNLRDALGNLETVCRKQSATRADQLLEAVQGEFQQVLEFIARAGGAEPLASQTSEESQPLSRWPAGQLSNEDQRVPLALPVSAEAQHAPTQALAEPVAPEHQAVTTR